MVYHFREEMDLCYQLLKEKWRMKIVDKFEHKDKLEDD